MLGRLLGRTQQLVNQQTVQQQHSIELAGVQVPYVLKRSKRATVGFVITDKGLQVTAPLRLKEADLQKIVLGKSSWIQSRLNEWAKRQNQYSELPTLLANQQTVPVLGKPYQVVYHNSETKTLINPWNQTIGLPCHVHAADALLHIEKALKAHAKEIFTHIAGKLLDQPAAQSIHLPAFTIQLSSANNRWGSCNSQRQVRLNWRLVHYPADQIRYVIAHELAHLVEMNHSSAFWSIVGELMPDYETAHKILSNMNPSKVPLS